MKIIYHLRNDQETIRDLQNGMKSKYSIVGLKNTHGLFASGKWWKAIENKKLKLLTIKGSITKTWPGHHDDFSEFEVTDTSGVTTTWPMEKMLLQNEINAVIEIDYVLQEYKSKSDIGSHSECIVEVRLGR